MNKPSVIYNGFSDGKAPGVFDKLWIGLTAGAIGSIVGTPAEIALIRMTADGRYTYYDSLCTKYFGL